MVSINYIDLEQMYLLFYSVRGLGQQLAFNKAFNSNGIESNWCAGQ